MAKVAITEDYLQDIADAIRQKTGLSSTYYPSEMAQAILSISGSGGITPTGTINITENGTHNVTQYASANVQVPNPSTGTLNITTNDTYDVTSYASAVVNVPTGSTINNQNKTVTPSEEGNTVTYDSGYTGLGTVTVEPISDTYVGSGITSRSSSDLTASGATVTAPAGYYASSASKAVSSMTLPTAAAATSSGTSKATISRSTSDQYINIPTGYNSTASYYKINAVADGTISYPTATKGTVSNHSISITPDVTFTEGYITGGTKTGTAVTVSASQLVSGNKSITGNGTGIDVTNYATVSVAVPTGSTINNQNKTVTPSTSSQEITADTGYTGLGTVTVEAMPNGSATGPSSLSASSASVSTGTNTLTLTKTGVTTTPTVSAGYVSSATASTATVALTASVTTKAAATITPGTTTTEIAAGTYLTGKQTISGDANLVAGNIKSGTSIFGVTGTYSGLEETNFVITLTADAEREMWIPDKTFAEISAAYSSNKTIGIQAEGAQPAAYNMVNSNTFMYVVHYPDDSVLYEDIYTLNSSGLALYQRNRLDPILQSKTVSYTPTESIQTETLSPDSGYTAISNVNITVGAIPSNYVGSGITSRSSSDLTASGATVTAPAGYYASAATKTISSGSATSAASISGSSATISTGTNTITLSKTVSNTPQVSAGYISSGTAGNSSVSLTASATIDPTPTASGATVTVPAGYYTTQTTKSVSSGSATGPSSLTDSSATISTGTNTITLTKTGVTTTPTVSAGYVSSATASTATVALTASVTTKAAATITPGTSNQTIASGTYLTGTQTISGDANLVAGNIKDGVSIFGVTGTYEGEGGGGSSILVGTKTATPAAAGSTITFTGLSGEPTSFAIVSASNLATGASPFKVSGVVYDGTNVIGQTVTNTSNAQVTYDGTNFSKSYSNGTLTVTSSSAYFQANEYKLTYSYNGTTSDVYTSDVQVGSGATSITFTELTDEPTYFSCIFKSNFSTSSGYQRVIMVVHDGTSTYGMEMDSNAKANTSHWSYTYNNGSLTISSSGTNAGGYFHQPGYYQLTYVISDGSGDTGVVTAPSTITGTSATVSTGTNTLTLTKTVSVTPDVTTPGYISRGTAGNSSVSLTASVTTKGAATITPGTANQTIASGTYLTGTQTINGDSNLVAGNIKSGTTIFGVTGTYEGSGGSISYDTKTATASNYPVSLSFTGMKGQPKFFTVRLNAQVSSSGNTTYYYIVNITSNGTNTHGNCFRIGSTRRVDNITSGYSYTYSGTTLTITSSAASRSASPGAFYSGSYELMYAY